MGCLSPIHGAVGFGYSSYNYGAGKKGTNIAAEQPQLWASVKEINAALAAIGRWLLDARLEASVTLKDGTCDLAFRAARRRNLC